MLRRATALKRICDRQRVQNAASERNSTLITISIPSRLPYNLSEYAFIHSSYLHRFSESCLSLPDLRSATYD